MPLRGLLVMDLMWEGPKPYLCSDMSSGSCLCHAGALAYWFICVAVHEPPCDGIVSNQGT